MFSYDNNDYRNYLAHHGILGMRWGKRNGPPYPLDASDHSASEKKAGWKKSLNGRHNQNLYGRDQKAVLREYRQKRIDENDKIIKEMQYTANREKLKRIAIGIGLTAGIGVGVYFAYKYDAINRIASLGNNVTSIQAKKVMADALNDVIKPKDLTSLRPDDIVLPKGTELHRMAAYEGIDYTKVSEPLYAAYKEKDIATYMTQLKDWSGTGKRYDVTLQALEDIRMPSKQTAKEIFEEIWKNDKTYKKEVFDDVYKCWEYIYKRGGLDTNSPVTKAAIRTRVKIDLSKDPFGQAIYSIVGKSGKGTQKLLNEYVKRGYTAIEDYFDKGGFTDSPVILINPSASVVKVGERVVTEAMKMDALKKIYGWTF